MPVLKRIADFRKNGITPIPLGAKKEQYVREQMQAMLQMRSLSVDRRLWPLRNTGSPVTMHTGDLVKALANDSEEETASGGTVKKAMQQLERRHWVVRATQDEKGKGGTPGYRLAGPPEKRVYLLRRNLWGPIGGGGAVLGDFDSRYPDDSSLRTADVGKKVVLCEPVFVSSVAIRTRDRFKRTQYFRSGDAITLLSGSEFLRDGQKVIADQDVEVRLKPGGRATLISAKRKSDDTVVLCGGRARSHHRNGDVEGELKTGRWIVSDSPIGFQQTWCWGDFGDWLDVFDKPRMTAVLVRRLLYVVLPKTGRRMLIGMHDAVLATSCSQQSEAFVEAVGKLEDFGSLRATMLESLGVSIHRAQVVAGERQDLSEDDRKLIHEYCRGKNGEGDPLINEPVCDHILFPMMYQVGHYRTKPKSSTNGAIVEVCLEQYIDEYVSLAFDEIEGGDDDSPRRGTTRRRRKSSRKKSSRRRSDQ